MDLQLRGKTVLVTGASRGIGRACARLLAEEGCNLHLASRTEADLAKVKAEIEAAHGVSVTIHPVDLAKPGNPAALAAACPDIDILVNNAGAVPGGDLWTVDEGRWREGWDLKVFGYVNLCRAIYPAMKARGHGVIVNVIGSAGEKPKANFIAGSTGNASLIAFTRALGTASVSHGIRVVGINPGVIRTERMIRQARIRAKEQFGDEDRWQEMLQTDPAPGDPEDVANLVAFLASPRAKNISGTVVTTDSGAVGR